jgi:hypothetical protein
MDRLINFLLLITVFLFSCSNDKEMMTESLTGDWLILYPDHHLRTKTERDVYARYQDSVVNLYGLKLIRIKANGEFIEGDSVFKAPGKWALANDKELQLREGGKGFNSFNTTIEGFDNDTLRLQQSLSLEKEKIKVVWHLKKVAEDSLAQRLLSARANDWRKKATGPESESAIRKRLVSLLNYYSDYLKLVSKESSYFLVPRVHLPFRYFQHSIGMKEEMPAGFTNLFYNEEDARKAYEILAATVNQLSNEFQWAENFVVEYGLFFKRMTYRINR